MAEKLHSGRHYEAFVLGDGSFVVMRKRAKDGNRGRRLTGPSASHWVAEIRTALDKDEAEALCRGFLNS